jgi:hypothetical protein
MALARISEGSAGRAKFCCSGNVARDVWVRGWLVRVHAVLKMRRLRIRSLELVGWLWDLGLNVRGVRVGAATPKERPATVELSSNCLEPTMSRIVQSPLLRFVPEAVLLIDQGVYAVEYRAFAHGPRVARRDGAPHAPTPGADRRFEDRMRTGLGTLALIGALVLPLGVVAPSASADGLCRAYRHSYADDH